MFSIFKIIKKLPFLIFVFCSILIFGQKKKRKVVLPPPPPGFDYGNRINKDFKPTSFENRIKKFPFNKATKIKIISYNLDFKKEPIPEPIPINDSLVIQKAKNRKNPVEFSEIISGNFNVVSQQRNLNITEIKELTNILYNTCGKYSTGIYSEAGCFFPRNAILFYDENDKVFAHLEICFQCGTKQENPKGILSSETMCNEIDEPLENFFNKVGISTKYSEK